jgi:FMN-dependent NADH-azoreductase
MLEDKDPDNVIKNNFATDYLGLNQENQRLRKENFELRNLPELVEKMLEGNLSESELQKKENQVAILKNEKNDLTAQLRNKDKIIKA